MGRRHPRHPRVQLAQRRCRPQLFHRPRSSKGAKVPDAPHESTILLDGARQGEYADKFIYGQDHAEPAAWGWSSVGKGGLNVGVWLMTNMEFSDGGPLKRDVSVYPYNELNNSILTGELGMGSDGFFANGERGPRPAGRGSLSQSTCRPRSPMPTGGSSSTKTPWPRPMRRRRRGHTRGSNIPVTFRPRAEGL